MSKVTLRHGKEEVEFTLATYRTTTIYNVDALFKNINNWLMTVPAFKQDEIFKIYVAMYDLMLIEGDYTEIMDVLIQGVEKLYDLIEPEAFMHWMDLHGNFNPPIDLFDNYEANNDYTAELTYLRHDYLSLMSLAESLRFMLPIWGMFISTYAKVIGTVWKEYTAIMLIGSSRINEVPAMIRLNEYIEESLKSVKGSLAASIKGLGREEIPAYQAAAAIIRKVAIGETCSSDTSIIKNVSNYVRNNTKAKQMEKRFVGDTRYAEKIVPNEKESPDNTSILEAENIKQQLPDGIYEVIKKSLTNPYVVAKTACADIPPELVDVCVKHVIRTKPTVIRARLMLAAFGVHRAIPVNSLSIIEDSINYYAIGITMAVFIHLGEYEAAALLTGDLMEPEVSLIAAASLNSAISKADYIGLDGLYHTDSAGETTMVARRQNMGYNAITEILAQLGDYSIKVNLPKQVIKHPDCELENGLPIPSNVKLAVVLIKLLRELH